MDEMEKLKTDLQVWEKVTDVAMHFNDLCLGLRKVAISMLGVLLGASGLAFKYGGAISFSYFRIHTACFFVMAAMVVWVAFYLMDRYWYHELLKGTVLHVRKLEQSMKNAIPHITLNTTIREISHRSLNMNAARKLDIFYGVVFLTLVAMLGVFIVADLPGSVSAN